VEVHDPDAVQCAVELATFRTVAPPSAGVVRKERIRETVVKPARSGIRETPWQDTEGRDAARDECSPELEIEECAPVCRARPRGVLCGHKMEGLAEVGGVLVEMKEGTIKWIIGFIWRTY
jgi:hypothetical protein